MALAQKHRLSKKDLDRVFKTGRTIRGGFSFVRFRENELGYGRVAVVVPSKISKKSAVRNRIKRIVLEAIRAGNTLKQPLDLVLVITSDIREMNFAEIKREIERVIG